MAESKVKNANYYQIQGWMINALGLKGISLSVFAIIYGFSQDGENEYTGSLQYLCDFTGGTSKPTIIKALKGLMEKQYIMRREEYINGVQFNKYKVNLPLLKNLNGGSKETLPGADKNLNGGSKEILPNNKDNNKEDNTNLHICMGTSFRTLRHRKPNQRSMAVHTLHASLWNSVRLFQHIRFIVCKSEH